MTDSVTTTKNTSVENSKKRLITATVISNKMDKTAVVTVTTKVAHPVYGKFQTRTTKMHVHDPKNELEIGDIVSIQMSRPISKKKTWILKEVISKDNVNAI